MIESSAEDKREIGRARPLGRAIRLRVLFQNRAIALYKRLGFVLIGNNEHQHIMERR